MNLTKYWLYDPGKLQVMAKNWQRPFARRECPTILNYPSGDLQEISFSEEMAVGKGMSGTGFQVAFKALGLVQGFKGDVELQFPGFELDGVTTFSAIVLFQTALQVGCVANVTLTGFCFAFQDICIEHGDGLCSQLRGRIQGPPTRKAMEDTILRSFPILACHP